MLTDTCRTSKREFANWESSCAAYCAGWSIISIPKQLQDWAHEIMIKAKIKKPGTWIHETAQRPSCRPVRCMCHVQALNTWATANHCCKRCVSPYVTAIPVQHHCLGQQTSSQPYCIHLFKMGHEKQTNDRLIANNISPMSLDTSASVDSPYVCGLKTHNKHSARATAF